MSGRHLNRLRGSRATELPADEEEVGPSESGEESEGEGEAPAANPFDLLQGSDDEVRAGCRALGGLRGVAHIVALARGVVARRDLHSSVRQVTTTHWVLYTWRSSALISSRISCRVCSRARL